jgi:hypothetical protein
MALLLGVLAAPAAAQPNTLEPLLSGEGLWLAGLNAGTEVDGSSGTAAVGKNGTTITVKATGLVPGQAVTMWVAYFNDVDECRFPDDGLSTCGFFDLVFGNGGFVLGAGHVIGGSGKATFSARLNVGDGFPSYEPTDTPYFLAIVRSHGPTIPGEVSVQTHGVFDGCDFPDVGPFPGTIGGEIPDAPRECGDVQLYVFETTPP